MNAAEALAAAGGVKPRCSCHDHPMQWFKTPGAWRCTRAFEERRRAKRAAQRAGIEVQPEPVQRKRLPFDGDPDKAAIEALRFQFPRLDDEQLVAELQRQRSLARSGSLAP